MTDQKRVKFDWERGASSAKVKALGWQPLYPNWRDGIEWNERRRQLKNQYYK